MKKHVKAIISLFSICAITAILLALTNYFTLPIIKKNESNKANEALLVVLPTGKDFQSVDLSKYTLPATVKEAYTEAGGGYVFKLETTGYSSGMVIMCGINADGTVSGAVCLSSGETLGHEKTYGDNLKGKNKDDILDVAIVSGATKTTEAYRGAVKDALNAAIILGGGTADLRSEEEILAENLATVLPAANGEFTLSYTDAFIAGDTITAVYKANNASGAVYVIDESFVGVDAEGNILSSDIPSDVKTKVEAAISTVKATEKIDLTQYNDISSRVKDARRNTDGTLILQVNGSGYGINGGDKWHPASGKPIVICLSIATDGSIIKCVTMAQEETKGFGAACGESSFYSQFDGKTQDNYQSVNVDAISKATMTKNGYMNAIKTAFETVEKLNGGAANE